MYSVDQWFLTFFVSFTLYQSQKIILPPTIFSVSRHEFFEKGLGEVPLEMNFCVYWNQF